MIQRIKQSQPIQPSQRLQHGVFQILVLMLMLFSVATQARSPAPGPSPQAGGHKAFFWEVKSKTATVYLFGSMHFAMEDFYPLRPAVNQAFEASDNLVVEVDITAVDPLAMQQKVLALGMYPGTETLKDHISTQTFSMISAYLASQGIPEAVALKQRPGLLMMTLTTLQLSKLGFSPALGLDLHFINRAKGKKKILELETVDEQFALLFGITEGDLLLQKTLEQLKTVETQFTDMANIWKRGD